MNSITPAALEAALNGDTANFILASTPNGIEAQEKRGQRDLVKSESLPKEMIHGCTREHLEKMGIVFGEDIDDIFVRAKLPEGWKKVATDHDMWSDLLDDKGRVRARIFYKAAFYDRNAHISLENRFRHRIYPEDMYKTDMTYEERKKGNWYGVVCDQNKVIFKTEPFQNADLYTEQPFIKQCKDWLDKNYPDWENPLAYWD